MADELEEVAANVRILIQAELDVGHRLEGHPVPIAGCPVCDARRRCA
jgi:hypothetical protein